MRVYGMKTYMLTLFALTIIGSIIFFSLQALCALLNIQYYSMIGYIIVLYVDWVILYPLQNHIQDKINE
jgi:hypothetical protein